MPQRYVDAKYLRLLHRKTIRRADFAAELDAYCFAFFAAEFDAELDTELDAYCFAFFAAEFDAELDADARPNCRTDAASDDSADVRTNTIPVHSGLRHGI